MLSQQSLSPEYLIERAQRRSRLRNFGDTPFQEGLQIFLRTCVAESDLSLFDRVETRWGVFFAYVSRFAISAELDRGARDPPVLSTVSATLSAQLGD